MPCRVFSSIAPLLLSCVYVLANRGGASAQDRLGLDEIASRLDGQRKQIRSLYVELKSYSTISVEPKVLVSWPSLGRTQLFRTEQQFAFKGGHRYSRTITSLKPLETEQQNESHGWQVSFNDAKGDDGDVTWERRVDLKRGPAQVFVSAGKATSQWVQQPKYFDNIGWDCKTEMNTKDESAVKLSHAHDLLYLMRQGACAVAESITKLDGAECILIRREFEMEFNPETRDGIPPVHRATEKLWLDLNYGFAVRQRELEVEKYCLTRTVNSDFIEILPGIWFPRKTEQPEFAPSDAPHEYQGRVIRTRHDDLVKWVVNDVRDERFEVVTKPSDILVDLRGSSAARRVIEAPAGLKSLRTLEGSRDPSVATQPSSSKSPPAPLTTEGTDLVNSLAESTSSVGREAIRIRTAILSLKGDEGTGDLRKILESKAPCKCEPLRAADIRAGALKSFDVLLVPGGGGSSQAKELGEQGRKAVREFVDAGGGYVGICAGGYLASAGSLALVDAKVSGSINALGPDGEMSIHMADRSGLVKMELTEAGRRVLGDLPGLLNTTYVGGPIFSPAGRRDLPAYVCLARFQTEVWLHEVQRGTMVNTPAILAARFGKGRVILFSAHPEVDETPELHPIIARAVLATARKSSDDQ